MYLIDTHAHIYLPEFNDDRNELIERAKAVNIQKILMPAIDSSTHTAMLETEAAFENCVAMMGLHPCSVNNSYNQELEIVLNHLAQRRFLAIGEIGLDFYWDKTFTTQQYDAFHQQINLALQYNLPIVIHSRNATDECIEVVKQYPAVKGVFHCFSGNLEQAQQIIELGFTLGIGGVVTFKNAGLDKLMPHIDLNHIILETDAPYLAPVPYRGKRNESSYLIQIVEKIGSLIDKSVADIAALTTQNAIKLFGLP